ncbi:unnamed protein product [Cochlearia groenlandica]
MQLVKKFQIKTKDKCGPSTTKAKDKSVAFETQKVVVKQEKDTRAQTKKFTLSPHIVMHSTMRRVITGVVPSAHEYDPMEIVQENKLKQLMEFVLMDE